MSRRNTRCMGGGVLYTEDLTYGGRMYPPEVTGK